MKNFEERDGDRVRRGRKYTYTPAWMPGNECPDSASFQDKAKVNIQPNFNSETFYCPYLNCGPQFTIEAKKLIDFCGLEREKCHIGPNFYQIPDNHGFWMALPRGEGLQRMQTQNHESIGDLKVTYETLKQFKTGEPQLVTIVGTQAPSI